MTDSAPVVFVVDDDRAVRTSTARLLRAQGFAVQCFASAGEFLAAPRPEGPACLVLDVRMPGQSGMELQRELALSDRTLPVVFVTGHGDIAMTVRAMKAGAVEFLTKPYRKAELLAAIRIAIDRDRAAHRERDAAETLRQCYARLTARERQVMALVVAGMLNKQIAAELATVERTIKFHRAHLMKKMRVGSIAELVRMAGRLGIAPSTAAAPVPRDS